MVICRAGALTLTELAIYNKACILVPFPFAAEDHQLKNAQYYKTMGAAEIIEQKFLNKGMLDADDVVGTVLFLISDYSRYMNGQSIVIDDGFSL